MKTKDSNFDVVLPRVLLSISMIAVIQLASISNPTRDIQYAMYCLMVSVPTWCALSYLVGQHDIQLKDEILDSIYGFLFILGLGSTGGWVSFLIVNVNGGISFFVFLLSFLASFAAAFKFERRLKSLHENHASDD